MATDVSDSMHVTVTGRNMPVSDALREYAVTKFNRFSRYLGKLSEIHVVLAAENAKESAGRNVAEATASVKGQVLRAACADADMYAAIDGLADRLHHQLTRVKERTRDHKRHGHHDESLGELAEEVVEGQGEPDLPEGDFESPPGDSIVEVKQYLMKPMFPEEAIDEMNELGHAFFVFLNARSEKVSVVYRRRDGLHGLIEPEFA